MEKILDKLERIARRWFCLICLAIFVLALAGSVAVHILIEHRAYDIPEGACYCPSCGTVMVIERQEAQK